MNGFRFKVPQEIIVEKNGLQRLPELLEKLGSSNTLMLTGPHLYKIGFVQQVEELLHQHGITTSCFWNIEGNPSVETVEMAAKVFEESKATSIVAIGGGSPMDVAKAVGVVAKYGGSITEYEGGGKVPGAIVPLIAVPTTAGTGSEVTAFSVITDHTRNYKLTVFSERLIPAYAILDPMLLVSLPQSVAAATGVDALVHAIEAYLSTAASPFSDAMAEKAMELLGANIRRFVANRTDIEAAEGMLVGSMFAGISFAWARLGDVHAMAHPLSAYFNLPHGVANAILLPVVLEFNALSDRGRYKVIYEYLTGKKEESFMTSQLAETVRELVVSLGIPDSLSALQVKEDKFEDMAVDAMKSGNIAVNPRTTTKEDIIRMYQDAF